MNSWARALPRRRLHLRVAGVRPPVANVVADGVGEQEGVLQHDADAPPQAVLGHAANVLAVDGNGAALDVVEPFQQADDRGLAGPGGSHQGHGLARLRHQIHPLQHRRLRLVGEFHVAQLDAALRHHQRPGVGRVLDLRLLIQQLEDALGAGDRGLELRPQHGDGAHRLEEPAHVLQEGHDDPDGHQLHARQVAAVAQHHGYADAADHVHGRSERGRQRFRANVGVAVGTVELAEAFRVPRLPVEGLRRPRAGYVLLQLGADAADGLAGLAECAAGALREHRRAHVHQRQQREAGQRQPPVERQHADQDREQQQEAGHQARQPHPHGAVDYLGVVGEARQQVARLVAVEVGQRQLVHLVHDLIAQLQQQPLADRGQRVAAAGVGEPADQKQHQHQHHGGGEPAPGRGAVRCARQVLLRPSTARPM